MKRMFASAIALSALVVASCATADDGAQTGANASAAPVAAAQAAVAEVSGPHPGEAVYKKSCAVCHDNPEATKAPSPETMARLTPGHITNALMTGIMIPQAVGLSSKDVSDVSNYLARGGGQDDGWTTAMRCPASRATPRLDAAPTVATFGFDIVNSRRLDPARVGLAGKDLTTLEVAWAIGFPNAITMRSQAAVVGSTLFVPVGESGNRLFAFDISDNAKPCIQWVYEGKQTLRTSAGFGVRSVCLPS